MPVPGTPKREAKAKESWRSFHHAGGEGKGAAMASRMAMVGGNLEIPMQRKRCKTTRSASGRKHGEAFRFERRRTFLGGNIRPYLTFAWFFWGGTSKLSFINFKPLLGPPFLFISMSKTPASSCFQSCQLCGQNPRLNSDRNVILP